MAMSMSMSMSMSIFWILDPHSLWTLTPSIPCSL